MRIGIVGAGVQARRRLAAFRPDDRLTAISALNSGDAARLAARYRGEAVSSWLEVVQRDDVDAVIVASPPRSHADIGIAALRAGTHVLCEKPLAATSEEAAAMTTAAATAGRVLHCGFNHRLHPAVVRLREFLASGAFGPVISAMAVYGHGIRDGYESEWRCDPACVSGGQLMEQGIHLVDLVDSMLGPVDRVVAHVGRSCTLPAGLEDEAHLMLGLSGGGVAMVRSSLTQWRNRFLLEVTCRKAILRVEGLGGSYGDETLIIERRTDGPFTTELLEFRGDDQSWRREWQQFHDLVAASAHSATADDAGLRSIVIVEAAYRSASSGQWVKITDGQ